MRGFVPVSRKLLRFIHKSALDRESKSEYNSNVKAIPMALTRAEPIPPRRREGNIMSEVRVRENESLESALKRFKRSCAKSGVLAEVRKREHYESPSVKRRKKSEAARKNRKKYY